MINILLRGVPLATNLYFKFFHVRHQIKLLAEAEQLRSTGSKFFKLRGIRLVRGLFEEKVRVRGKGGRVGEGGRKGGRRDIEIV